VKEFISGSYRLEGIDVRVDVRDERDGFHGYLVMIPGCLDTKCPRGEGWLG